MSPKSSAASLLDSMRRQWDRFARDDPMFYIAIRDAPWTEEEFFATGRQLAEDMLSWAGTDLGRHRMLDLGCGLGRATAGFAPHFDHVDAVDISAVMIERARCLDPPANVHLAVTNGKDLREFADERFDFVFSALVFQHIPSLSVIGSYVSEISRVLRPAGRAILQFDTRRPNLLSRVYERMPVAPGRTRGRFIRRYRRDRDRIVELICSAGMRIADERGSETAEHYVRLEKVRSKK